MTFGAARAAMTRTLLVVAPLVLTLGCRAGGDASPTTPPPLDDMFVSGTRLSAEYFDGGGGARMFAGWFDEALRVRCEFGSAEDGVERCLPFDTALGRVYHADADCSRPAALVPVDDGETGVCERPRPRYVVTLWRPTARQPAPPVMPYHCRDNDFRPFPFSVHRVGAALSADARANLFQGDAAGCIRASLHPSATAFALERIPPTKLVAAFREHEVKARAGTSGVAQRYQRAEDGSAAVVALHDEKRGELCNATSDWYGEQWRCFPVALDGGIVHGNASCNDPGVIRQGNCQATVIRLRERLGFRFHERGPERTLTTIYGGSPSECMPFDSGPITFVGLGPQVPLEAFPALPLAKVGGGRLQTTAHTSGTEAVLPMDYFGFWDTLRGEHCRPRKFVDGSTRCVPEHAVFGFDAGGLTMTPLFRDAQCTDQIIRTRRRKEPTPEAPPRIALRLAPGCMPSSATVIESVVTVGEYIPRDAILYARMPHGACAPIDAAGDDHLVRLYDHHAQGPAVSADSFAAIPPRD